MKSRLRVMPVPSALTGLLAGVLAGGLLGASGMAAPARAHEVPARVTVHAFVKPDGGLLRVLVRVPLESLRDVEWTLHGPGYLDLRAAEPLLADAARLWIRDYLVIFEDGRRLDSGDVASVRISLPSDRSFMSWDAALAHVRAPPPGADTELVWQQALVDVLLEYPIASAESRFAVQPLLAHLGITTTTVLRFVPRAGVERVFQYTGDPGVVQLEPRWHHATLRFVKLGFLHILGGIDHLLFILCLVIPFRRLRPLVLIVTAFTVAHSITLIAAALGVVPRVLWFAPLIEMLIAASIVYMAFENIFGARLERRWAIAFAFGLVHGFGFSFVLRDSLQFAGGHLAASLLAFNIGVELGQLLVLLIAVPALELVYRWFARGREALAHTRGDAAQVPGDGRESLQPAFASVERIGTIVLSALVAHTAWHWLAERWTVLRQYDVAWPALDAAFLAGVLRALLLLLIAAGAAWLVYGLSRRLAAGAKVASGTASGGRIASGDRMASSVKTALIVAVTTSLMIVPAPAMAQVTGIERARVLLDMTVRYQDQDAERALGYAREALGVLGGAREPRLEADLLASVAWAEMVLGNYDEATRRAEQARELAHAVGYDAGEALALNNLGVIARRQGDARRAVQLFTQSLALRERIGASAEIAMSHNNLGFVYSTDLGDFERSLSHHQEALKIRERLGRPAELALSLNNIGVLYHAMGELDRAQEFLERALVLRREHEIPLRVAGTLSNLGEVLLEKGDAVAALGHFRTALGIREEAQEPSSIAASHLHIGRALTVLGEHAAAEASLARALSMTQELDETRSLVRAHQRIGQLDAARGRHAAAERSYQRAIAFAEEMGARHLVAELWGNVADVRQAAGQLAGALDALRMHKRLSDNVVDEEKARALANLEAHYDAEQREREIESLRRQQALAELSLARQRMLRNVLAIAALLLIGVGFLLHRRRFAIEREVTRRLEVAVRTDSLTGLPNRRAFLERAQAERTRMKRSGGPAAVVVADVDHFKAFNDRHGHALGDDVLRHVGALLTSSVRQLDVLARWGGEEFVLLLPETTVAGGVVLAEKLRAALAGAVMEVGGQSVALTMTFGVAPARPDSEVEEWIAEADAALYRGKAAGRDRVVAAAAVGEAAAVEAAATDAARG